MNKKLIITVGISGSGKSTWSHEQWLLNPTTTILVNRDKIRELLFGFTEQTISEYYQLLNVNELEKQITLYENTLIKEALAQNKTVIVDATHLKKEYIERFKFWNIPTEIKFFDIALVEAINRDSLRSRKVGKDIIQKQFNLYNKLDKNIIIDVIEPFNINTNLPKCDIFDIDGTIAKMNNRSPFDWEKVGKDYPINSILKWISKANFPIIVSGRDEICRKETEDWLLLHLGFLPKLYMRKEKDMRTDWIVKEEIWREIAKDFYIDVLFDDREQVVNRARNLGLKCIQCEYNNF